MNKNLTLILLLISAYPKIYFAQEKVPESCYVQAITSITSIQPDDTNFTDLEFFKAELENNQIIILGESGHGDGGSFEAKTRLIKFLVDEMGYTTLAFEGGGFMEMNFASSRIARGKSLKAEFIYSWYSLWSESKQTQPLLEYLEGKTDLNYLGIENQLGNRYSWSFIPIIDSLVGKEAFIGVDFDSVTTDVRNLMRYPYDSNLRETFSLEKVKSELEIIRENVALLNHNNSDIVVQALLNVEGTIKQNELFYGSHEEYNQSISLRDSLMASNVIWYLDRFPNEKVIIWTANFHATNNLNQAIYKDDDDFYQTMIPLGQRLKTKYGNKVFSIAMISTEGNSAIWHVPEPYPIIIPENSWDYQLGEVITDDYAFVNFKKIREDTNCSNMKFESSILGYHLHTGNWFNMFDGIIYIRKMYRSEKANTLDKE